MLSLIIIQIYIHINSTTRKFVVFYMLFILLIVGFDLKICSFVITKKWEIVRPLDGVVMLDHPRLH